MAARRETPVVPRMTRPATDREPAAVAGVAAEVGHPVGAGAEAPVAAGAGAEVAAGVGVAPGLAAGVVVAARVKQRKYNKRRKTRRRSLDRPVVLRRTRYTCVTYRLQTVIVTFTSG